jgi:dipeptidyl aminopeptidase/acylaminoacyl peptidase
MARTQTLTPLASHGSLVIAIDRFRSSRLLLCTALFMAACTTGTGLGPAATQADSSAVLPPNANLLAQGIPPIPQSLVTQVSRYTQFGGNSFVAWHPTQPQMLVTHRKTGDSVTHIHSVGAAMARPQALTEGPDTVRVASYEPRAGRYVVFGRSKGGDEAMQLFHLDPATRQATQFTAPTEAHALVGWINPAGNITPELIYTAVPLDRTAQGGSRAELTTTVWRVNPEQASSTQRKLVELPGTGWLGGDVSPDGKTAAFVRYRSAEDSQLWLLDTSSGARRQVLPSPAESTPEKPAKPASHFFGAFSADGQRIFFISDRAGEFRELMALDLPTAKITRISAHIPWDVSSPKLSADGQTLAVRVNADGREELRWFDAHTLAERTPPQAPKGNIGAMAFHPQLPLLAFSVDSERGPGELKVLDARSGSLTGWSRATVPAGINFDGMLPQQIERFKSFDGLTISAVVQRPPQRFTGKRPVVVLIHGGPEGQSKVSFNGRWNYFVNELGAALIEPNVRGSTGYGKTFLSLDNGRKREDSVKDIGALLDWIAQQPDLDPRRVLIVGGSYGGYMALATSVHYSERIVGAIPVVGISNFVSFLTRTESYRRDLRRAEYGDERDPAMRAFLESISPLNHAAKIKKPLFVVQGKNDPRVPYTESEQIVERVRANGLPVWYLRADNEGHGFVRKENADFQFFAMIKFAEMTLFK